MRILRALLDEDEILLGERQHGDAGEIHLLRAGEVQQKVERAFEAGKVDDEALLGKAARLATLLPQVIHRRIRTATLSSCGFGPVPCTSPLFIVPRARACGSPLAAAVRPPRSWR
jgi:hypothetical protein